MTAFCAHVPIGLASRANSTHFFIVDSFVRDARERRARREPAAMLACLGRPKSATPNPCRICSPPRAPPHDVPLAERMRPRTIDEVVGQSHLLGPGKPLRVAFESARPHSMILWGPPGVGQDDAGAPDGRCVRPRFHCDLRGARRRQGHPRCGRRAPRRRGPAPAGRPSCSSTKCIASTRPSRTPSCRMSSRGSSSSSAQRPRIRRSRSWARCCRAPRSTCWSR